MIEFAEKHSKPLKLLLKILIVVVMIVPVVSYFYESDSERARKSKMWTATPENQAYWELKKLNRLKGITCELIADQLAENLKNQRYCSSEFSDFTHGSKLILKMQNSWFGSLGIPKEHRSLDSMDIRAADLPCQDFVLKWKYCPTRFNQSKSY